VEGLRAKGRFRISDGDVDLPVDPSGLMRSPSSSAEPLAKHHRWAENDSGVANSSTIPPQEPFGEAARGLTRGPAGWLGRASSAIGQLIIRVWDQRQRGKIRLIDATPEDATEAKRRLDVKWRKT